MKSIRSYILIILVAVGCTNGGSSPSQSSNDNSIPPVPVITGDMETVFAAARVFCDKPDCPGYVGMLVSKVRYGDEVGVGQCTISLISDDTVVTNSHCIPQELRHADAPCGDSIDLLFPKTAKYPAERLACATVISASEITTDKSSPDYLKRPDYAILKLSQSINRPKLKINRDGIPDNMPLTVYSADPLSTTAPWAKITAVTCVSRQGSAKEPSYVQPGYQIATMGDCWINDGDSGSAVVDSSGAARAFAQGSMGVASAMLNGREIDTRLTFATNAACMQFPTDIAASDIAANCTQKLSMDDRILQLVLTADTTPLQTGFEKWAAQNSDYFGWETQKIVINKDPRIPVIAPHIKCIKDPSQWKNSPPKTDPLMPSLFAPKDVISVHLPIWAFKGDIDTKMLLTLKVQMPIEYIMKAEFDEASLVKDHAVRISVETQELQDKETKTESIHVGLCAD